LELSQLPWSCENKTELFSFLSGVLHDSFQLADTELVITGRDDGLRKPPVLYLYTSALAPCNHEEAESDIMLHAAHAAHSGHKKILIRTVDTDVVVLAVALARSPFTHHILKEEGVDQYREVFLRLGSP